MNVNEYSENCLFKFIVSKYQVVSRSVIILLLRKLTTVIPDLMESFGHNIADLNK